MSESPLNLAARGREELMRDEHELSLFANFKTASADVLHPGLRHDSLFDGQRAVFRPPPSK